MKIIVNGMAKSTPAKNSLLATQSDCWLNLLACMGNDLRNPPLGQLLAAYHCLAGDWLIVTPIHWEVTHNDAMIIAAGSALTLESGQQWYQAVNTFLADEGFSLHFHDDTHWLLKMQDKPTLTSPAVHQVLHQSLMPILADMDKSLYWQRLFTELQMYLTNHPLNEERGELLSINGLWFYGHGKLQFPKGIKIFSDDYVLCQAFPQNIKPLERDLIPQKNTIVLLKNDEHCQLLAAKIEESCMRAEWYWNNIAYETPKKNKILNWWRKCFHANKKKNN